MTDTSSYMPEGEHPLQSWMHRPMNLRLPNMAALPELHVIVGRDAHSSGVTIYSWEPTGGTHAHYKVVFAARWAAPVSSTEEAVRIAQNAATAALAALLGPETPA
jgi:hypothetical protein